ncbi:MAG TPA: EAL domain-containing protein [Gemmatimonadaceae bacterium]|jgi:diguanylate cyclase (GGDEF)-like protein/PAS domain S-box-containing protein|nr:EAL domain-containing protein [Gemmatimonadaceae bacterium]
MAMKQTLGTAQRRVRADPVRAEPEFPPRNDVLLIHDNTAEAALIQAMLAGTHTVEWVTCLSDGLECLQRKGGGAVIVNLSLSDRQGFAIFERVVLAAPYIPIVVLGTVADEDVARRAVQQGAHDYLLREHLDQYSLRRALHYAIQRTAADEALFLEKDRVRVTLNLIGDAVLSTDIAGNVTDLNPVAERMTGWSRREAIGQSLADVFQIIDGATCETARNPLELVIQDNTTVGLTTNRILIRCDGSESVIEDSAALIHDRDAQMTGVVIVFRDLKETRTMVDKMSYLAQHDGLTGLPNRMLLNDRLAQAIATANRHDTHLAVLFVDVDRFKHINDSLGHAIGDQLLQSVAARLVACVRGTDTVSRQGGDEFVILLSDVTNTKNAAISAAKIMAALRMPHEVAAHTLDISTSIGISTYPKDGWDAETLLASADAAMYHAKEHGRNQYQFFQHAMSVRAVERQSLEESLRRALERQEFVLHYQPKIHLETGMITGVEALVRWQHPERGLISPAHFVPIAEDCGCMLPLGQWTLREACWQARTWQDMGLWPAHMAVNISAAEFRSKGFLDGVRIILQETRLDPGCLEIELTESVLMQEVESTTAMLGALKTMGVQLAVDDFGTGYSSLSYLRRFPIDTIKIDRSFVRNIRVDADAATIVSAVINMGKSLNQRVIGEGVETQDQCAFLQAHGCDEGQGYYFGRPVDAAEFAKVLGTGGSDVVLKTWVGTAPPREQDTPSHDLSM